MKHRWTRILVGLTCRSAGRAATRPYHKIKISRWGEATNEPVYNPNKISTPSGRHIPMMSLLDGA